MYPVLTSRELEVINLLAEGLSNKLIGVNLCISEHTVKFHVDGLMRKLKVNNRTQVVVKGIKCGAVKLDGFTVTAYNEAINCSNMAPNV